MHSNMDMLLHDLCSLRESSASVFIPSKRTELSRGRILSVYKGTLIWYSFDLQIVPRAVRMNGKNRDRTKGGVFGVPMWSYHGSGPSEGGSKEYV